MSVPDLDSFLHNQTDTAGRHTIKLPEGRHKIWAVSCTHFGAEGFDAVAWKRHLTRAKREKWRLLHLGDVNEAVTMTWRATDMNNVRGQSLSPMEQVEEAARQLDQVQFDACVTGNHDVRFTRNIGGNLWADLVIPRMKRQRPVHLGFTGYLTYKIGKAAVNVVMNHTAGGGAANQSNGMNRLRSANEGADLYLGGQNHKPYLEALSVRTPTGKRTVFYVRAGSYLGGAGYADEANYPAGGSVGSWLITISEAGVEGFELLF